MRATSAWTRVVVAAVTLGGIPAAAQISQGRDSDDNVVLRDSSFSSRAEAVCPPTASFTDKALFRVRSDGTRESEPFTVPAGRHLVITDVEWTVDALSTGLSLIPGGTVLTRLQIGSGDTFNQVFLSRTVDVGAESGRITGSEHLTTGVEVAPNTAICPGAAESSSNTVISARLLEIALRGYLINTK